MSMLQIGLIGDPVRLTVLSGDAAIKALGQVTDNEGSIRRKRTKQRLKERSQLRRFRAEQALQTRLRPMAHPVEQGVPHRIFGQL